MDDVITHRSHSDLTRQAAREIHVSHVENFIKSTVGFIIIMKFFFSGTHRGGDDVIESLVFMGVHRHVAGRDEGAIDDVDGLG